MELTINGELQQVGPVRQLTEVIRELGLEPGQVVVEQNGQALTPSELSKAAVKDGDVLEIVQIVAGG